MIYFAVICRSSKANDLVKGVFGSIVPVLPGENLSMRILVSCNFCNFISRQKRYQSWQGKLFAPPTLFINIKTHLCNTEILRHRKVLFVDAKKEKNKNKCNSRTPSQNHPISRKLFYMDLRNYKSSNSKNKAFPHCQRILSSAQMFS